MIAQSQTRALKSKSLDLLATVCAPKCLLQNLLDNPAMAKKPRMVVDSSTKLIEQSIESINNLQSTAVKSQTMPAYSFHTSPLLGYHMPQCFKQHIWQNIRTQRLGFEVV